MLIKLYDVNIILIQLYYVYMILVNVHEVYMSLVNFSPITDHAENQFSEMSLFLKSTLEYAKIMICILDQPKSIEKNQNTPTKVLRSVSTSP